MRGEMHKFEFSFLVACRQLCASKSRTNAKRQNVGCKHKKRRAKFKCMTITKILLTVVTVTFLSSVTVGQNCSAISGTKDKKKGYEAYGGVTNTKDHYSLLIQKINYTDSIITAPYLFFLNAATRVLFNDSILNTFGTFELKLTDGSTIEIDSVRFQNNPLGFCCTLGFQANSITEEIIIRLSQTPIETIKVKGILTTSFSPKKQKEQQTIFTCLLNRNFK